MGEICTWSWTVFKDRMWPCIYLFWGAFAINWTIAIASQLAETGLVAVIHDPLSFAAINMFLMIASTVFQTWLAIGLARGFLKIGRGEPVAFDVLFSGGRYLLTVILGAIVFRIPDRLPDVRASSCDRHAIRLQCAGDPRLHCWSSWPWPVRVVWS